MNVKLLKVHRVLSAVIVHLIELSNHARQTEITIRRTESKSVTIWWRRPRKGTWGDPDWRNWGSW